ncbi:hypothetical protein ACLKA7_001352 [Drosophila subpalustris]
MHAGAHATCAFVRQRFWVINARQLARKTVRSCIACFRQRPVLANQIMGSLPASRVQQGLHPFERAGLDYAGPLWMHFNQRGRRPVKVYLIVAVHHAFWRRWSLEYLTLLQERSKWTSTCSNIQQGTLVLIGEDNTPPGQWALGRVHEVHTGADGAVRVVTIKTKTGFFKRNVHKICPLPMADRNQENLEEASKAGKMTDGESKPLEAIKPLEGICLFALPSKRTAFFKGIYYDTFKIAYSSFQFQFGSISHEEVFEFPSSLQSDDCSFQFVLKLLQLGRHGRLLVHVLNRIFSLAISSMPRTSRAPPPSYFLEMSFMHQS